MPGPYCSPPTFRPHASPACSSPCPSEPPAGYGEHQNAKDALVELRELARVADVAEFTDAVGRVAAGGTALDREMVSQLLAASRHAGDLDPLTPRERDVLALMAEGRSNAGVAAALVLTLGTVEKHVASIFGKLGLPASETDNRRVLAVLRYLGS